MTLRAKRIHPHRRATRGKARRGPFAPAEGPCSRARLHSALGHLAPEQAKPMAGQPPPKHGRIRVVSEGWRPAHRDAQPHRQRPSSVLLSHAGPGEAN